MIPNAHTRCRSSHQADAKKEAAAAREEAEAAKKEAAEAEESIQAARQQMAIAQETSTRLTAEKVRREGLSLGALRQGKLYIYNTI